MIYIFYDEKVEYKNHSSIIKRKLSVSIYTFEKKRKKNKKCHFVKKKIELNAVKLKYCYETRNLQSLEVRNKVE